MAKKAQVDENAAPVHTGEARDGTMGPSDLTTDKPGSGKSEVVGDGRPPAPTVSNGSVAKKRKKQKALAAVAANGHVAKVAKRKSPGSNGHKPADDEAEVPAASNGAVVTDDRTLELPAVEDVDDVGRPAAGNVELEELDAEEAAREAELAEFYAEEAAREEAEAAEAAALLARIAEAEPKLRRRAAKRARAARRATPAARRAELVATAAAIAAAAAEAEAAAQAKRSGRAGKYFRRFVALVAICLVPAAVYALVVTDGPVSDLPAADAAYISEQLITADQRVRQRLVQLRPLRTSAAIARTRESQLTARSLSLEVGDHGGSAARRLQRALTLEASWLDAVGSVLSNPRSALRDQLVAREAALRPALAALPNTENLRRKGGSANLRDFAKARLAAKRKRSRS